MAFDAVAALGLKGGFDKGLPRIQSPSASQGGIGVSMGPSNRNLYLQDKVTTAASATWIRGDHTIKFGDEWKLDNCIDNVVETWVFNAAQTGLPASQGRSLQGGSIGFPYASFLPGRVNNGSVPNPQDPQYRRAALGLFVLDTWMLTLDYGLRWDQQPAPPSATARCRSSATSGAATPSGWGSTRSTSQPPPVVRRPSCCTPGWTTT
jgi:hypothetical protein